MHKLDSFNFQMTSTEKIANAKKRIDELERLIKYWDKSEGETSGVLKIPLEVENKVA